MEGQIGRLTRYLDEAWAVEKALVSTLDKLAATTSDPTVKALFVEHRRTTHKQEERLEERLRDFGKQPSATKGFFNTMLSKMSEAIYPAHDDVEKVTQDLMLLFAVENFEAAMYQSLRAYADTIGDHETVRLAEEHLSDEQQTAHRIWNLIAPSAGRPAGNAPTETDVSESIFPMASAENSAPTASTFPMPESEKPVHTASSFPTADTNAPASNTGAAIPNSEREVVS